MTDDRGRHFYKIIHNIRMGHVRIGGPTAPQTPNKGQFHHTKTKEPGAVEVLELTLYDDIYYIYIYLVMGVDVHPPRHSARPFHHIRPIIRSMHPSTSPSYSREPITQDPSPCCLAVYHKQPERTLSPFPPFPRPSSSPAAPA